MTTATLMDKKSPSSRTLDHLTGRYYPALTDGFIALKEFQGFVSSHNGPVDVNDLPVYVTAMIVEWVEFLQETNWKPWKPTKPVDMDRLAEGGHWYTGTAPEATAELGESGVALALSHLHHALGLQR